MKVYTKAGDGGHSSTIDGVRHSKADLVFEVLGDIDELNSHLGLLDYYASDKNIKNIQTQLFTLGAYIAGADCSLDDFKADKLEAEIDNISAGLPKLTEFIVPSGSRASIEAHICRAVARRLERSMVRSSTSYDVQVMAWVNRLSDYLFTLARGLNNNKTIEE